MRQVLSLVSILVGYGALQVFLYSSVKSSFSRTIHDLKKRRTAERLLKMFFLLALAVPIVSRASLILGGLPDVWSKMFLYPFAVWSLGSTLSALILLGFRVMEQARKKTEPVASSGPVSRRDFLRRGTAIMASPFLFSAYGTSYGRTNLEVERFRIQVKDLPPSLEGLKIVHLTDLHAGPFMPARKIGHAVKRANDLHPDLVVLTGDLVAAAERDIDSLTEGLKDLRSRYGVYGCLGNHEVFAKVEEVLTSRLLRMDMRVLRNEAASLEIKGTRVELIGIDDLRAGKGDLKAGLATSLGGDLRILLSHRPEVVQDAAEANIHLVLSGHYHGGQIRLGFGQASVSVATFMTPYDEGIFHVKDTVLFVGRGIGITGVPLRVNCPPQIALLEIVSSA